ncbi:MAG: cytochrome c1 [Thioalkalivibrionaceae bacterium]
MKNLIATMMIGAAAVLGAPVQAAGPSVPLDSVTIDTTNEAQLQRGARLFVNYCMGCHSTKYMRYSRVGRDIGLTENEVADYLIFQFDDGEQKSPGSLMTIAMASEYGAEAFGKAPPDLTLTARIRGTDWLYTFLRSFYLDESRPLGVNNTVFGNVGMPHVLWELQGFQRKVVDDEGHTHFEQAVPGSMTGAEYDRAIRDLVTYLAYLGEPVRDDRRVVGFWVLLFLGLFTVLAYFLKKEYWKDIKH